MKIAVEVVTCRGIYCGKRMNKRTGGGFRYRQPLQFAKLDYITWRKKGFCCERCQEETVKASN